MDERAGEAQLGYLPPEATTFIGRRDELADAAELLTGTRLLTLTGAGGSGKTRLALRLAAERAEFPDGVWCVQLSGLQDPDLLAHAIAERLQLADQTSRPQLDVVTEFLADKRLLLILDTCEHLVDACALLAEVLLRAAPGLRILATSRQRLNIVGEQVFLVPPLSVPDPDAPDYDPMAAASHDAVRLFADRAAEAEPAFRLDARNEAAVVRLCRRLDGLPLAIELAAGWVSTLSVEQLSERLDDRFQLLAGGTRAELPRHETMRTTIGWSHELCSPLERLLWTRLSVFPAEFDLEAAERVCGDEQLPPGKISWLLSALVGKSILMSQESPAGLRFRQLDTLREYGRSWLVRLGAEEVRQQTRHRDHYLRLAQDFDAGWRGPEQLSWLLRLQSELPNIRAAMDFSLSAPGQTHAALDLSGRLVFLWLAYAATEGRLHLDRALQTPGDATPERARALWARSWVAVVLNDPDGTADFAARGRAVAERIDDPEAAGYALFLQGVHHAFYGDAEASVDLVQRAADLHGRRGDRVIGLPFALSVLSTAFLRLDRPGDAIGMLEVARSMCEVSGEEWARSYVDFYQVNAELAIGDHAAAARFALTSLRAKIRMRDILGQCLAIDALAGATVAAGDAARAAQLLGIARQLADSAGLGYAGLAMIRSKAEPRARELLGDAAFRAAVAEGRNRSHAEALAYALGDG
ncbi:AAA family ATPase [Streptomyces sp. A7024]|uniref:AAA family ATPase n=1 Tax=Streptomyces coryli TaxID=1128680 RepID=A0A6G4TZ25_9ACTN|nr:AAA family ATPase [Streptomyces coryli]NGN65012.1 AAA family ATPase [Streptomyces coryli]